MFYFSFLFKSIRVNKFFKIFTILLFLFPSFSFIQVHRFEFFKIRKRKKKHEENEKFKSPTCVSRSSSAYSFVISNVLYSFDYRFNRSLVSAFTEQILRNFTYRMPREYVIVYCLRTSFTQLSDF